MTVTSVEVPAAAAVTVDIPPAASVLVELATGAALVVGQTAGPVEVYVDMPGVTAGTPGLRGPAGIPGPAGPPGTDSGDVATVSYRHYQTTAAAVWTVIHPLGFQPNVTVVDSSGREVWPGDVEYLTSNTVRLVFSAAFGGEAYLS